MSAVVGDGVAWSYGWSTLEGTVREIVTAPDHPDVSYHFPASQDDPWAIISMADNPDHVMAFPVDILRVTHHPIESRAPVLAVEPVDEPALVVDDEPPPHQPDSDVPDLPQE